MTKIEKRIYNDVEALNDRLRQIAKAYGPDSFIYENAVNVISASLPDNFLRTNKSGVVQIRNTSTTREHLKAPGHKARSQKMLNLRQQIPTASKIEKGIKEDIARERGITSKKGIAAEVKRITPEQVQEYIDAKSLVYAHMDGGKINYDASIAAELSKPGSKSYEELAAILRQMEGDDNNAPVQPQPVSQSVEASYDKGRVNIQ